MKEISVGRRDICSLGFADCKQTEQALQPGDFVLTKTTNNPLSRLIADLDGWWSHSAIAISPTEIAHANADGVTIESVASFREHYSEGLAVVRPALRGVSDPASVRQRAADRAREIAGQPAKYAADELGIAFSLLYRLGQQPTVDELAKATAFDSEFLGGDSELPSEVYQATCSAFVYQSYLSGADHRIAIDTAPGVRLENGMLRVPDFDELVAELHADVPADITADPFLGSGKRKLLAIGAKGILSAIRSLRDNEPVPVEIGVTPGDLWMSPGGERWFIKGHTQAVEAAAACAQTER